MVWWGGGIVRVLNWFLFGNWTVCHSVADGEIVIDSVGVETVFNWVETEVDEWFLDSVEKEQKILLWPSLPQLVHNILSPS